MRAAEQDRARFTWKRVRDVAEELDCSPAHVRQLLAEGALTFEGVPQPIDVRRSGSRRAEHRIPPEAVEHFKLARAVGAR